MGSSFMQQFMAGWQMGQGRNENLRRNQELEMEKARQQQMLQQRAEEFELQKEEFAVRRKQLAAQEAAHKLSAAQEARKLREEANYLQGMPKPTAAEVGVPQQGPEFGGPLVSEINVPQPTQAMPDPSGGADIQMPVLTGRQQQEMEQRAKQQKLLEALGMLRAQEGIKAEFRQPERPVSVAPGGTLVDPKTGKVVFRAPERTGGTGTSGAGTVGPDGQPVASPFGTARSEGEKNKVSVAKDAVRNMPRWQQFIEDNSNKFGFYAGRATKATQSGALSPFGVEPDPKMAAFMAEIGRMSNDMLNALSGAAISPAEFERLKQQIPQLEDHPTVLKEKMAALDDYFKFRLQNYNAPYEGPGWQRDRARQAGAAWTPQTGSPSKPGVTINGVLVEEE